MRSLINFVTGTLLTGIVYFLGGLDMALEILLVMIGLDYFTGLLKAVFNKKINSEVGAKRNYKKSGLFSYNCCSNYAR